MTKTVKKTVTKKNDVDEFLKQEKLAVLGVSRKKMKFGSMVFRELKKRKYQVFPVNPNTPELEGETCYKDLQSLPEKVGGAVIVLKPAQTEKVVKDVVEAGITRVWMQQGSQSETAVKYCKENNVTVISNECILMFADPVVTFHKFHRWLWKVFKKLPR